MAMRNMKRTASRLAVSLLCLAGAGAGHDLAHQEFLVPVRAIEPYLKTPIAAPEIAGPHGLRQQKPITHGCGECLDHRDRLEHRLAHAVSAERVGLQRRGPFHARASTWRRRQDATMAEHRHQGDRFEPGHPGSTWQPEPALVAARDHTGQ